MVFVFSNTFYAQTATAKKVKTEKKTTTTTTKLKKDGTPDKRYKTESKVVLKKDGTVDKRYKNTSTSVTTTKAKKLTPAEEKEDMKETAASKAEEKKVKDKATGSYKGKKVFTGPRGGKYYINKNGNKTYIDRDE